MKSTARFSATVVLGTLLCLAASAFGQSSVLGQRASRGSSVMSQTPATLLVLAVGSKPQHLDNHHGNDGCDSNGRDRMRGGSCHSVPEGGSAFVYLALAGLCCLVPMIFRIPRQARPSETKWR